MNLEEYQNYAQQTAIYPPEHRKTYPLLGLVGEIGEFCNKYKKVLRDGREFPMDDMISELGDILWYVANVCEDFDINLQEVAEKNIEKLVDRQKRGVLGGSGDNR